MVARITVNVVREPKANQEPILSSGSFISTQSSLKLKMSFRTAGGV